MKDEPKLGPTGKFPQGKIQENDEGEIQLAVGVEQNANVFIDFGIPVKWVAFPPEQAFEVANIIALNSKKAMLVAEKIAEQKEKTKIVGANGIPVKTN